jgi:hypothetical protein
MPPSETGRSIPESDKSTDDCSIERAEEVVSDNQKCKASQNELNRSSKQPDKEEAKRCRFRVELSDREARSEGIQKPHRIADEERYFSANTKSCVLRSVIDRPRS